MLKLVPSLFVVFAINTLAFGADTNDDLAKKSALDFITAFKTNNIDAAMKVVSLPFFVKNQELFIDKNNLEKYLSTEFKKNNGKVDKLQVKVKESHLFEALKEQITEDKEKVFQVLKDGDKVVILDISIEDKAIEVAIGVAIRNGKSSVVAFAKLGEK